MSPALAGGFFTAGVKPKTQATEKASPGQVLNIDLIGKQDQLKGLTEK